MQIAHTRVGLYGSIQDVIAKLAAIKEERGNIPVVVGVKGALYWNFDDPRFVVGDIKGETKVAILP
jgi:hypothetical protein